MAQSRVDPPAADSPDDRTEAPELDAVVARATILEGQLAAGVALMPFPGARDAADRAREVMSAARRRIELAKWLVTKGLWSRMTDAERWFVEVAPHLVSKQDLVDASWTAESLWVLLWALGAMRAAQDGVFPFALADDFPAFGRPYREASANAWTSLRSIAAERHRSLNWLCGYAPGNRWDETPTDT